MKRALLASGAVPLKVGRQRPDNWIKFTGNMALQISEEEKEEEEEQSFQTDDDADDNEEEQEFNPEEEFNWPEASSTADAVEKLELFDERGSAMIREKDAKVYRANPQDSERHMSKARGRWYQKRLQQKRTWYDWQREAMVLSYSPRTEGYLLGPEDEEEKDFVSRRDSFVGKQ